MNKAMTLPLVIMFILTIFSTIYTDTYYSSSTPDYSETGDILLDNASGTVDIPTAGPQSFNIWGLSGAMVILTIAITVGILAGIHVIGTGISETSQKIIVMGILYLGLWAYLSIVSATFFFVNTITIVFWVSLTTIYIVGFGSELTGGDTA